MKTPTKLFGRGSLYLNLFVCLFKVYSGSTASGFVLHYYVTTVTCQAEYPPF